MKEYILLIGSVAAGGFIAAGLGKLKESYIKMLLTFSGAYLLSIAVFHLLPEIYESHHHTYGLYIMLGFVVQLVLEVFSKGMEHGHSHPELFKGKGLPFGVVLSLFMHAFLESMPIGAHAEEVARNALLWGIVIHKLPVSIILFLMMKELTSNRYGLIGMMLLFALIAPLGVWVGSIIPFFQDYYRELTAFVLGIFIHISTTILFEFNQSHRFNLAKFSMIIIAIAIAWFTVSHH